VDHVDIYPGVYVHSFSVYRRGDNNVPVATNYTKNVVYNEALL